MPIPENITKWELQLPLNKYDEYIQEANNIDKYSTGWQPVCINEFYDNELSECVTK